MANQESIVDKLGLNQVSDATAQRLLDALYKVEEEQGYLNETVTTLVSYLHSRQSQKGKPTVYFESRHESGNIFALLGKVNSALQDKDAFNALWAEIQKGSYEQAINLIKERVNLIDLDGNY